MPTPTTTCLTVKRYGSVGEYVDEQAHTNGIESFWALLKWGYYGTYRATRKSHTNEWRNPYPVGWVIVNFRCVWSNPKVLS